MEYIENFYKFLINDSIKNKCRDISIKELNIYKDNFINFINKNIVSQDFFDRYEFYKIILVSINNTKIENKHHLESIKIFIDRNDKKSPVKKIRNNLNKIDKLFNSFIEIVNNKVNENQKRNKFLKI